MDSHEIAERARLLSHRHYARVVDEAPEFVASARALIDRAIAEHGGTSGHQMWALLLKKDWNEIRRAMLSDNPDGRLLRSNSPFSQLFGITDEAERVRLWKAAKSSIPKT